MTRKNVWLLGLTTIALAGGVLLLNPFAGRDGDHDTSSSSWHDEESHGPAGDLSSQGGGEGRLERTAVTNEGPVDTTDEDEDDEPRPAVTVSGRVVTDGGAPVVAARVAVHYRMSVSGASPRDFGGGGNRNAFRTRSAGPAVKTDSDGRFTLAGRAYASSSLEVQVVHKDFAPASLQREWQRKDGALSLGDIVIDSGAVVTGFVVDTNGGAIASAEVSFQQDGRGGGGFAFGGRGGRGGRGGNANSEGLPTMENLVGTVKTDPTGFFRLEHVPSGSFRLQARASHFLPALTDPIEAKAAAAVDAGHVQLVLGVELRGIVVDTTGAPVADARVEAGPSRRRGDDNQGSGAPNGDRSAIDWQAMAAAWRTGGADRRARTNKSGEFVLDSLPPGLLRLTVEHPRFVTEEQEPVDPKTEPKVVVRLETALALSGRVIDEQTGKPIPVYAIAAREVNDWGNRGGPGGDQNQRSRGRRGGGDAGQGPDQGRRRGGSDDNNGGGNEAQDAQRAADEARRAQRTAYVQTRLGPSGQVPRNAGRPGQHEDGRFTLPGLQPGRYVLDVLAEDFVSVAAGPVELVKGQTTGELTIALRRGSRITGLVEDKIASTPLANATVDLLLPDTENTAPTANESPWNMFRRDAGRVRVARTRTDAQGRFTLRPQQSGEYWLQIEHESYNTLLDRSVFVPDGRTLETPTYRIVPGSEVVGRVLNGLPDKTYTLTFWSTTTQQRLTARADKELTYRVEGIEPGSYYVLLSDGSEGDTRGGGGRRGGMGGMGAMGTRLLDIVRGNSKPDIVVTEGSKVQYDVDARAQAAGTVRGKIHLNGAPAAGLDVALNGTEQNADNNNGGGGGRGDLAGRIMGRMLSGRTDDKGEFEIDNVPAGSYSLEVRRGGGGGGGRGRGGRGGFGGGPTLHREPLVVAQGARIERTLTFATGGATFEVTQESDGKPLERGNVSLVLRSEGASVAPDQWRTLASFTNAQVRNGAASIRDLKLGEWMYRLTMQGGGGRGGRGQGNQAATTQPATTQPAANPTPPAVEGVAFVGAGEPTPIRLKVKDVATPTVPGGNR